MPEDPGIGQPPRAVVLEVDARPGVDAVDGLVHDPSVDAVADRVGDRGRAHQRPADGLGPAGVQARSAAAKGRLPRRTEANDDQRRCAGRGVELLRSYSKQRSDLAELAKLLERGGHRRTRRQVIQKQQQRRLRPGEAVELVAAYQGGATVGELARRFELHHTTVTAHLERHGVPRRRSGLDQAHHAEAALLYETGWSLAKVGAHFGVDAETVRTVLRKRGVAIRSRRGWH